MMKTILSIGATVLIWFTNCDSDTQKTTGNEPASTSIDRLYQDFTTAYQSLDVDLVTNLYVESAHYLPGNPNLATMTSRNEIEESFAGYFEWAKTNGNDLNISFRIIKRDITDSLAYDVGYYLIQSKSKDEQEFEEGGNVGKFVTVMGLQQDGSWKFLLDGFSPAPYAAFFADSTAHTPGRF
jgi:ketosteroid isomerase-like protein